MSRAVRVGLLLVGGAVLVGVLLLVRRGDDPRAAVVRAVARAVADGRSDDLAPLVDPDHRPALAGEWAEVAATEAVLEQVAAAADVKRPGAGATVRAIRLPSPLRAFAGSGRPTVDLDEGGQTGRVTAGDAVVWVRRDADGRWRVRLPSPDPLDAAPGGAALAGGAGWQAACDRRATAHREAVRRALAPVWAAAEQFRQQLAGGELDPDAVGEAVRHLRVLAAAAGGN